ncbi:MAG: fluoride efflux transporter CrcB [Deferrisomatales bacterium]
MPNTFYVILGAACGASGRYLVAGWMSRAVPSAFPWGTLTVNLLGCLVIGLSWGVAERALWAPAFRTFLFIGVLGSFTTFSSFGLETLQLLRDGELARAVSYVLGSNLGGLAAVWLGLMAAR